ncbi:hypothetical protein [Achromobacter insuavis]|uniref:hypothetical protein n=1 Tax=Achromobacter insuavis TaxID=1287735 RepID=UPI001F132ABD|nr:hypothetical protein [Achromobacter insuavis]
MVVVTYAARVSNAASGTYTPSALRPVRRLGLPRILGGGPGQFAALCARLDHLQQRHRPFYVREGIAAPGNAVASHAAFHVGHVQGALFVAFQGCHLALELVKAGFLGFGQAALFRFGASQDGGHLHHFAGLGFADFCQRYIGLQ